MKGDRKVKEIILTLVERTVREYQPEKVILFGSYAYGEPTRDSDIDFLVVAEGRLSAGEAYGMRRDFYKDYSVSVQLVCMSREEFEETRDIVGGIAYPAAKYGETLYEKP